MQLIQLFTSLETIASLGASVVSAIKESQAAGRIRAVDASGTPLSAVEFAAHVDRAVAQASSAGDAAGDRINQRS